MPSTESPAMWADETRLLYEEWPEYIKKLESPYREYYPTSQSREDELFRNLVEVKTYLLNNPLCSILLEEQDLQCI